jgi:membrane protein
MSTASPDRARSFGELRDQWRSLEDRIARTGLKGIVKDIYRAFGANKLLTYASAMSYQVLFAIVPALLASLALLGFLNLTEVWRNDLAPRLRDQTSEAGFTVIDQTVVKVLSSQRGFWLTFGILLAVWEVSGAVRATMGALDDVYGVHERRSFAARMTVSIALAVAIGLLVILAFAAAQLSGFLARRSGIAGAGNLAAHVGGWCLAVILLVVAVWLLLRFGPSAPRSEAIVSLATVLVVLLWSAASVVFGFYASRFASYGSIYGSLAFGIILMTYLYVSAVAFLLGVQLDAYVRDLLGNGGGGPGGPGGG